MLFPSVFDDESFYSLVGRLIRLNDLYPGHPGFVALFDDQVVAADLRIDLERFSQVTKRAYGDVEEIEARFGGSRATNQETLIGYSNTHRNIWKWCTECAEEDVIKEGVTYWRHRLQHPCYLVCLNHKVALRQINLPYRNRQSRFITPDEANQRINTPACSNADLSLALDITGITEAIINSDVPVDTNIFSQLPSYKDAEWQKRGARVTKILAPNDSKHQALIMSLVNNSLLAWNYLPVAIYSSFSNYDLFMEHLKWSLIFEVPQTRGTNGRSEHHKEYHRDVWTRYKGSSPDASRTDFWRCHPDSARWLLKHDRQWFNRNNPKKGQYGWQLKLF